MITHNGARTRALYKWEREDLDYRPQAKKMSLLALHNFADRVWCGEKWNKWHSRPFIYESGMRTNGNNYSYALGRAKIYLNVDDMNKITLTHELIHCRGYGSGRQMHPVSFVKMYVYLLAKYSGFDYDELYFQAASRGLI